MRAQRLVLALLVLGFAAQAEARNPRYEQPKSLGDQVDTALRRTWHPDGPGATVLVSRDGEDELERAERKR